jgi:hypothetical protein
MEMLTAFVEGVEKERAELRADEPHREHERSEPGDPVALVHRALCEVGGLVGKERIATDVISPALLADGSDDDVGSLLAGEFMGDFGGFLSRELRVSDFALGYESSVAWLREGLGACDLPEQVCARTVDSVEQRRRYRLEEVRSGQSRLSDLSLRDRVQLARLAAHGARVLVSGAVDLRSRLPDGLGRAIRSARDRLPLGARSGDGSPGR